jgi:hypothetical protein
MKESPLKSQIGTLSEKSLHASLKKWYAQPSDRIEVMVEGYVIDIVRENSLIEIQTGNFSALRHKLPNLLDSHSLHLIYPIASEKWIVRETESGELIGRRKSPKRGQVIDIFYELMYIPQVPANPHFSLEVLLIREEEILRDDGKGSWRRKGWSIHDHRLLEVVDHMVFRSPADYLALLPPDLATPFTNHDLAKGLNRRLSLAQRITYTLRKMGVITQVGKSGKKFLYQINS